MTRVLGRFAFLLLFHLTMVASGYACASPAMTMDHEQHGQHRQTPSPSQGCTAPASCAPAMNLAAEVSIEPIAAAPSALPAFSGAPAVLDRAAPDTPPPRV